MNRDEMIKEAERLLAVSRNNLKEVKQDLDAIERVFQLSSKTPTKPVLH